MFGGVGVGIRGDDAVEEKIRGICVADSELERRSGGDVAFTEEEMIQCTNQKSSIGSISQLSHLGLSKSAVDTTP